MAEAAKTGLLDLEKELTCSVRQTLATTDNEAWKPTSRPSAQSSGKTFGTVVYAIWLANMLMDRSVQRSSISPSLYLTAYTPSAAPVSRNGFPSRPLKQKPPSRIPSLAHHVAPQCEIRGQTPKSRRCWRCLSRQTLVRAEQKKRR